MVSSKIKTDLHRIIIAALSPNGVIGNKNKIPWKSKEELQHFKKSTLGYPVIFGRKTFENLKSPLEKRLNIIISNSNKKFSNNPNVLQFKSLYLAYKYLRLNHYKKVFIAGGSIIYRNAIKHAEEMIISRMKNEFEGDKFFPKINKRIWNVVDKNDYNEFIVFHYIRRKKSK